VVQLLRPTTRLHLTTTAICPASPTTHCISVILTKGAKDYKEGDDAESKS